MVCTTRAEYEFIRARLDDNPIYANDVEYRRTLEALPEHLRRAFLDGDWSIFCRPILQHFRYRAAHRAAGRRPARAVVAAVGFRSTGVFHHPSAVYWHCAVPASAGFQPAFVSRS